MLTDVSIASSDDAEQRLEESLISDEAAAAIRCQQVRSLKRSILQEVYNETPNSAKGTCSLTYGELSLASFEIVLMTALRFLEKDAMPAIRPERQMKFCDIGSGYGRLVASACLCEHFNKSVGIEVVPELHAAAVAARDRMLCHSLRDFVMDSTTSVDLMCLDATTAEAIGAWYDADVLYICCTLFSVDLMHLIGELVQNHLEAGSILITVSKRLPCDISSVIPLNEIEVECTWGSATVFFSRKK